MAKINLKDKQFTTIDGRILNIEEYFTEKDFVSDDNGQGNFIKHDALMRVCKKLFSIVGRSVNIIRAPSAANGMCAAATVTYILFAKEINSGEIGTQHFSFTSSGDCNPQNAPSFPADRYMTAMAETRASGRALRFLLGVDFCTKEEIAGKAKEYIDDDPISKNALSMIEKKFMGQHGIKIEQMRKLLKKSEGDMPNLSYLTVSEGGELVQKLNRYLDKLKEEE